MPQTNPGTEVQDTEMTDASQQPRSANTSGTPDPGTATRASSRAKRRAPTIVLADQPRDTTARQDSAEGEPTQEWDSAQQEEQEEQKEPADTDEVSTASKRRMARSHALTGLRPDVKNDLPKRAIVRTKPRVIIPAPPPADCAIGALWLALRGGGHRLPGVPQPSPVRHRGCRGPQRARGDPRRLRGPDLRREVAQ